MFRSSAQNSLDLASSSTTRHLLRPVVLIVDLVRDFLQVLHVSTAQHTTVLDNHNMNLSLAITFHSFKGGESYDTLKILIHMNLSTNLTHLDH